jgi:branched-chain amino acid transport system substrate-binding protein
MQALLAGATKADSFDRSAVADALRQDAIPTLLSDLRFEPDGDLVAPKIWIYQVVDGEFQQIQ